MIAKKSYGELEQEIIFLKAKLEEKKVKSYFLKCILHSNSEMSVIATDIDFNIKFINKQAEETFGINSVEVQGFNVNDLHLFNEHDASKIDEIRYTLEKNTKCGFYSTIFTNGELIQFKSSVSKLWDKGNKHIGYVMFTIDYRKQASRKIEMQKLSTAVEQSSNSIIITDKEGNIEYANPKFLDITEYSLEEIIGKNPRIINSGTQDKLYFKTLWDAILTGNTWKGEICNQTKSGKLFWEYNTITPITDTDGKIINFLAVKEDINARKIAEKELKEQNLQYIELNKALIKAMHKAEESNRLKTEFINNMSHEIRTPLNGILGFSSLLKRENISQAERNKFVDIISVSGERLLSVIDDILEISLIESKQLNYTEDEVCINKLLNEINLEFSFKHHQGVKFNLNKTVDDNLSTILTDKSKLYKILYKLIDNSFKFTPQGTIEVGYNIVESRIELYVKDTGVGINSEKFDAIFDRFTQEDTGLSRKAGGLGLGLAISKENAKLINGEIKLKSEKGKGSIFYLSIPYKRIATFGFDDTIIAGTVDGKRKFTILIAEDDEINFLFLETLLHEKIKEDCQIFHANDGQEAIDICSKHPELDLVFMDIKMPKIDGYEATRQIRKSGRNIPIIAQTAYTTSDERIMAKKAGCNSVIIKPIDESILEYNIQKYLLKTEMLS